MRQRIDKVPSPQMAVSISIKPVRIGIIKEHHVAHPPRNWRQVPLHGNQHDQHHAPPENRHGVTGQRQANGGVIENGAALNGSKYTHGIPTATAKIIAQTPSSSVALKRGTNSSHTGKRLFSEIPKSPCITPAYSGGIAATSAYPDRVQPAVEHDAQGDPTFTCHDHNRIAGDHMDEGKGEKSDTDKRGDDESQTSENELQHNPDSL
jgi:hypothetical protein